MTDALAASPLARAVGLALLEFLWQGAAIGVGTALVLIALRRSGAQLRYLVACASLALMVAAPIATAAGHLRDRQEPAGRAFAGTNPSPLTAVSSSVVLEEAVTAPPRVFSRAWIERQLPYIVLIWTAGVLVLAVQLFGGWMRLARSRREASLLADRSLIETVRRLAGRLRITRPVRLIESAIVEVPAVIGWLRPAIILPASALAGLAPAQLEAILAHELAHIRRGDYLVNLVQCVVEILLFYHPAVWWASRRIRVEREHCCDDVATTLCTDRAAYARALVSLEELRTDSSTLAMAASGGDLLNRIRRLLDPSFSSGPRLSGGFAMSVALTVLVLAFGGSLQSRPAPDPHPVAAVSPIVNPAPAPAPPTVTSSEPKPTPAVAPRPRPQPAPTSQQSIAVPSVVVGRGRVIGVVTDPQGGVIPGATVAVTAAGGDAQKTVSNAAGRFTFDDVAAGDLELAVTLPGFKTSKHVVTIHASETFTARVQLELGSLAETIRVVGGQVAPPATASVDAGAVTLGSAADYFDAANRYYEQGRVEDGRLMVSRGMAKLDVGGPTPLTSGAPIAEGGQGPIRVGGSIKEPKKIKDVRPAYPADALAAGVAGVVVMEAVIATDGTVRDVSVVYGVPQLNDAALDAVRQWRFTPTLLNGVAVEVFMTVNINFTPFER